MRCRIILISISLALMLLAISVEIGGVIDGQVASGRTSVGFVAG